MSSRFWIEKAAPLVFVSLFLIGVMHPVGGHASVAGLDGVGRDVSCGLHSTYPANGPDCASQLLTTTGNNDVIILITRSSASSIIDSNGLSYTLRAFRNEISEYYAIARTPVKGDNVTVVLPHCCALGIQVFAIQGANKKITFDPRPAFPVINSHCGYSINFGACSASIDKARHDFIIASTLLNDAGCPEATIASEGFSRVGGNGFLEVDYDIVGHLQHNVSFTCPSEAVVVLLDAVFIS